MLKKDISIIGDCKLADKGLKIRIIQPQLYQDLGEFED